MALTNWNDILNKPKGINEVPEIALTVEQLSASVLSISADVGEIALDVSQLSASVLTIGEKVEELEDDIITFNFNITINSDATGATGIYDIITPENYTVISFTPNYNADLFFYNSAKNQPSFSFGSDPNTLRITIKDGNIGDTENRTLSFKAIAKKNAAQITTQETKRKQQRKK